MQLLVGRVGRAHGVRGEVTVEVRTDDPESRFAAGSVLVTDPAERGPLTVVQARPRPGGLIVAFAGVTGREAADQLRDTLLLVDSDTLAPLDDPDQFYDHELVGLAAVLPTGEPLGTVADVVHAPAGDLLVIGDPDGHEHLVPFVAAIVTAVDRTARHVVVDPPPGLLELS